MKHIKAFLSFALLLTLIVSLLCGFAMADVLPEPPTRDEFYEEHYEEFVGVYMNYYVDSNSGSAEVYDAPNGTVSRSLVNGTQFYVYESYTDSNGMVWLYCDYGYIKLSDCEEVYTSIQFTRDHADSIFPFTGDMSQFMGAENAVFWTYPNSGEYFLIYEEPLDENFSIDSVYTDENGKTWGNVVYYYAFKNFWVSLSDISGTGEMPVSSASPVETPITGNSPQTSDGAPNYILLAVIMVAAIVGITLLLIFGSKKKKK